MIDGRFRWNQLVTLLLFAALAAIPACDGDEPSSPVPLPKGVFTNPVLESAPDPWVVRRGEYYYVTHSAGDKIILYKTAKMSALYGAEVKTIWTPPSTGMNSKNIHAPELHYILNTWYLYYTADDGDNANRRIWVLENSNADPMADTWIDRGKLELPGDDYASDGTLFSSGSTIYFAWSGMEDDDAEERNIYLVEMTDPLTPTGDRIVVSAPTFAWETKGGPPYVNEAPQFLEGPGRLYVTFSASGCWTDDYTLGLISADPASDLLDPESWLKEAQPVFQRNPQAKAFGPGHNAFFKSIDGKEDWIVYHANEFANGDCNNARSMRMQKFEWVAGKPDFGDPAIVGIHLPVPSGEL